tara:strand:- start:1891 stop:2547 length:657 start_codon:yes stop_codon:yes gene_type:complete
MANWLSRASKRAVEGAPLGIAGILGNVIAGKNRGAWSADKPLGGLWGRDQPPPDVSATPEQSAAFERQNQVRREAIELARESGDAAARDQAQVAALAYGKAQEGPEGGALISGLRSVGADANVARTEGKLRGKIFEQEASPAAAERKNIAWLTQQIESMRAAGRLTPQAIEGLIPMAESEAAIAFLNDQRDRSPAESSLLGDVGNVASYVLGNPLDRS